MIYLKKSRVLSILLTLVMLTMLWPGTVFAASPFINNAVFDSDGDGWARMHVSFSEGIYGDVGHTTPVTKDDFALAFAQNGGAVSNAVISSIRTTGNSDPVGGETSLLFYLALTGGPSSGVETITLAASGFDSIYNMTGESMLPGNIIGPIHLNDKLKPMFSTDYPKAGSPLAAGSKQIELLVMANESGTAYYVVELDNAITPAPSQISLGNNWLNAAPLAAGNGAVVTGVEKSFIITDPDLADATDYDIFVAIKDEAGNLNEITRVVQVTTPATGEEPSGNETHTVTFALNGGTHTGGGALEQTIANGAAATAPTTTRSGYVFAGWDKAFSEVTEDMTVTARWTAAGNATYGAAAYTVTFDLNGGMRTGGGALVQAIPYGGAAVAPVATKDGFTFTGWDKAFSAVTASLTVTAQWTLVEVDQADGLVEIPRTDDNGSPVMPLALVGVCFLGLVQLLSRKGKKM